MPVVPVVVDPDEVPVVVEPDVLLPVVVVPETPPHGPGTLVGCPTVMQASRPIFSSANQASTSTWLPMCVAGVSTVAWAGDVAVPPSSGMQTPFGSGPPPGKANHDASPRSGS